MELKLIDNTNDNETTTNNEESVITTEQLIDSAFINLSDGDLNDLSKDMQYKVSQHNMSVSSYMMSSNIEILVSVLINKGIMTMEDYQNNLNSKINEDGFIPYMAAIAKNIKTELNS